ncbi:hypothetical protein [Streptomyces sp. AC555_RSS877]|uniref:hypothetical protein n=1 Tax=Streptomyces sp. AC555_RSS877 TaxID=2823688 RepID=UPI001C270487|nr:hypothetical protein [Streptomyces sp. AC555_RSS877]
MTEPVPLPRTAAPPTELVVAPVTITPTKPLTPTHIKGLIWTDLIAKATAHVTGVRLVWNNRMAAITVQSTAFWRYLDLTEPEKDWSSETEQGIGERYVRFHSERRESDPRALERYLGRADEDGWIHPAGCRMLQLWRAQLDLLGIGDLGLADDRPLAMSAASLIDALAAHGLLIDHRRYGGPVHLDGSRWGMPLRQLISGDGLPNYLLPILRELIPLVRPARAFLLIHDDGLTADYLLLARVLTTFGADVTRLAISRVPVNGAALSSRYGGWQGVTLTDLSSSPGTASRAAYRLGMRMYFAGTLHRDSAQSFRMPLLRRCVGRAARLLVQAPAGSDGAPGARLTAELSRLQAQQGYVDPYRLMSSLQGDRALPLTPVLRAICT